MNSSIWQSIDTIQSTLNLSPENIFDYLELTSSEFIQIRSGNKELPIKNLIFFAQRLEISFDHLITGDINYKILASKHLKSEIFLPEKYAIGSLSKRRSVITFLSYLEMRFGAKKTSKMLNHFQMDYRLFNDPEETINLRFALDLGKYLLKYYNNESLLRDMCQYNAVVHRDSQMAEELKQVPNLTDAYDLMFGTLVDKYIEKNLSWKLQRLDRDIIYISSTPKKEAIELIGKEHITNSIGCMFRKGFVQSIPIYFNLPPAKVEKISCVATGDRCCLYKVNPLHLH